MSVIGIPPYAVASHLGSQSFAGFVHAPVQGPLSTSQYPCAMPYHSYGALPGIRPTPPQFVVSPPPANMSVLPRRQYVRATALSVAQQAHQNALGKLSSPSLKVSYSSQRQFPVSSHVNYIAPISNSMYVDVLKSKAVGKSAYKVGLPPDALLSTKSYDTSFRRSALQRARSGGCVAPRKKGSIYNTSLTQPGICAWGAVPRQNY